MAEAKKRCSARAVFRAHMEELTRAIPDAEILRVALGLYAKEIISENTRDKINLPNQTQIEKNALLLQAIEQDVSSPGVLDALMDILDEVGPGAHVAQVMRAELSK